MTSDPDWVIASVLIAGVVVRAAAQQLVAGVAAALTRRQRRKQARIPTTPTAGRRDV